MIVAALPSLSRAQSIAAATAPPSFPKMFVGKPEFNTKVGSRSAGTACLAKFENNPQVYLLTVRHLLGPAGGFPELVPPDQVPSFVTSIQLSNLFGGGSKAYRVNALLVPATADTKGPLFNAAIFKTNVAFPTDAVMVTTDKPALGETVWIVAHVRASKEPFFHTAKIINNGERWLIADFDENEIVPNGASGAPVLNAAGKIAGVYCTHSNKEGKVLAYAIPSVLLAQLVAGQAAPR